MLVDLCGVEHVQDVGNLGVRKGAQQAIFNRRDGSDDDGRSAFGIGKTRPPATGEATQARSAIQPPPRRWGSWRAPQAADVAETFAALIGFTFSPQSIKVGQGDVFLHLNPLSRETHECIQRDHDRTPPPRRQQAVA